jgi:hypothetical protein
LGALTEAIGGQKGKADWTIVGEDFNAAQPGSREGYREGVWRADRELDKWAKGLGLQKQGKGEPTWERTSTGQRAKLDHIFLRTKEKQELDVTTKEPPHPSHDHATLDIIVPSTMIATTGKAKIAGTRRRLEFHEWEESGAAAAFREAMGREDGRVRGDGTDVMEGVERWRKVSREVADKIVGKTVGRKQRQRFDNQEVQRGMWQLKQLRNKGGQTKTGMRRGNIRAPGTGGEADPP